jgi:predicted house-cleaning NTP pyrophosphatase (Maf/HAM1 superfamily)
MIFFILLPATLYLYASLCICQAYELVHYLDTEGHVDKAGSYAIQEVNDAFVEELVGDYDNVVGLSLRLVGEMLARFRAGEGDGA